MPKRRTQRPKTNAPTTTQVVLAHNLKQTAALLNHPSKLIDSRSKLHQFRVQTRLATAALLLCARTFEPAEAKSAATLLRKLRRAAGKVRDLEVAGAIILTRIPANTKAGKAVKSELKRRGKKARHAAARSLNSKSRRRVKRAALRAGKSKESPSITTDAAVRAAVRTALLRFERAAKRNISVPENIHRVRRRLRTLRLIIDLALPLCPVPDLARAAPSLKKWQLLLGEINDLFRARRLFSKVRRRLLDKGKSDSSLARVSHRLRREHDTAVAKTAAAFRKAGHWPRLAHWCKPHPRRVTLSA